MACCGSAVQRGAGVLRSGRTIRYVLVPRDDLDGYDDHSETYATELEARAVAGATHVARAVVV